MSASVDAAGGVAGVSSFLRKWWLQPDRYDWTTAFLRQRGLDRSARVVMAVVNVSATAVPISVALSPHQSAVRTTVAAGITGLFALASMAFWLTRWPTRWQSIALTVVGMICTAAWTLTEANTTVATLTCTATAATGAYAAFFHGLKLLAGNFALATVLAAVAATRLESEAGISAAVSAFWLILFVNLVMPLAIWGTVSAMGSYAHRSDHDPLTGLLNRRGFIDAITREIIGSRADGTYLSIHMVDLDHFKQVNDTLGHAAGDRLLTAVAGQLRRCSPPSSTICRAGGEEFLLAVLSESATEAKNVASELCDAISHVSPSVTASVGCATMALEGPASRRTLEGLIEAADGAMYAAKRNGGHRVHYA